MTNREINKKLKAATEAAVPDVWERISAGCDGEIVPVETALTVVETTDAPPKKHRPRWLSYALTAAAAIAVTLGTVFGVNQYTNHVDSVVILDVNPSIELTANSKDRVVDATALNADGEAVLDGMDLAGTDLQVAVNALVGSMLSHGYIDELANSILLTVENPNTEKGRALQEKLSADIDGQLTAASLASSVLSQSLAADREARELASTYGISVGKVALIQKVLEKNPHLTFEALVGLSVNELNLLLKGVDGVEGLTSTGQPSDKGYIGTKAAKKAALTHAGIAKADATFEKVEMDFDDGMMIYDVDFTAWGVEYEYEINALDGSVISFEPAPQPAGQTPQYQPAQPQPQAPVAETPQPQPQPQPAEQSQAPQPPPEIPDDDDVDVPDDVPDELDDWDVPDEDDDDEDDDDD